jgi:hypothetical protein
LDNREIEELRDMHNVVGKYKAVWNRQDGKCYYCGLPILIDQKKSTVCMRKTKSDYTKNIAYIHKKCEQHEVEFTNTEDPIENYEDISNFLRILSQKPKRKKVYRKFGALAEYFHKKTEALFTLTFEDLSDILGMSLCKSAFKLSGYWHQKIPGTISDAWLSNGYNIKSVSLRNQKIIFVRTSDKLPVKIPDVFIQGCIPKNAKAELETFLDYLMKKYGL